MSSMRMQHSQQTVQQQWRQLQRFTQLQPERQRTCPASLDHQQQQQQARSQLCRGCGCLHLVQVLLHPTVHCSCPCHHGARAPPQQRGDHGLPAWVRSWTLQPMLALRLMAVDTGMHGRDGNSGLCSFSRRLASTLQHLLNLPYGKLWAAAYRFTESEVERHINARRDARRPKTTTTYSSHPAKVQVVTADPRTSGLCMQLRCRTSSCRPLEMCAHAVFCRHDPASGLPRAEPYGTDSTQPHGVAVAARVLEWLADNMPGLEYQRRAPCLVRHWQAAFPRCTAAQMNLRLRIHLQNLTE